MFGITLSSILSSFTKLEAQLNEFITIQGEKLEVNANKQSALANEAEELTREQAKAERVLAKVSELVK